jgi:hypothetical protein
MNREVVKMGLDYSVGIKQSYSSHHYILQNVLILKTVLVPCYLMKHFSPFIGDPAPTVDK